VRLLWLASNAGPATDAGGAAAINAEADTWEGPLPARRSVRRYSLGAAPLLSLIASIGLIVIASANNKARLGESGSEALFWAGLLLIYLPIALRLFGQSASRQERMAIGVVLGVALYIVKVVHSPSGFTLHDELAFWRGVWDLLRGGHLFSENPLVGGYSVFPGMTAVTGALTQLSGLSIFVSALILIGVARVVLMVALFLILERAAASARIAGIALVVYACNPSILYFDSQFGYESLALALAGACLLVVMRGAGFDSRRRRAPVVNLLGGLLLLTGGLVITHHLTTYAMIAFFALWAVAIAVGEHRPLSAQLLRPGPRLQPALASISATVRSRLPIGPALGCLLLAAAALIWFVFVAGGATQDELGSVFADATSALFHLVFGGGGTKTLFRAGTGQVDPLVVRVLGIASVGILALVIPLGVWRVWRSRRSSALAVSLAIVAMLYPFTLVPRLTQAGSEISQRASEFVFVGIGFVAAVLFAHLTSSVSRGRSRLYSLIATGLVGLVFVGGVILGESPVTRQPGPFEVGAESRSISPQGASAARFAAAHLPRDSRILVDSPNGLLLGSYGHLDPVIGGIRGIPITEVFFSKRLNKADRIVIVHDAIDYIVVDRRLSTSLPVDGHYFDREEPRANERVNPIAAASLAKFDKIPGISRIFDNGPIVIYDTVGIRAR
jgi:hypothetical protein